jgi:hypothetical protein
MSEQHTQYPWLFEGAYATYSGISRLLDVPGKLEIASRIEVRDTDLANQRARIRVATSSVMRRGWGLTKKLGDTEAEDWVRIGERVFPTATPVILESEYEGFINIKGLGVRRCFVRQYLEPQPQTRIVLAAEIVFWDEEFGWPLESITLASYKSKIPRDMLADALKDSFRVLSAVISNLSGSSSVYFDDALKDTQNEILREWTHIMHLNQTNIPVLKDAIQGGPR